MTAGSIHERLAILETKIDALHEDLLTLTSLEKRIGSLERWRAFLVGGGVVLSAIISWLAGK